MNIVIGTANFKKEYGQKFFNKVDLPKIKKFIKNKNILFFDIAEVYEAYDQLTKVVNANSKIIFKLNLEKEKKIKEKIIFLMNKFNLKQIFAVLIHNKVNWSNKNFLKNIKLLLDFKKYKIIHKIGYSIYDQSELHSIYQHRKLFTPDIIQLPINLFDQRFLKNKQILFFKKKGCNIHARSIFLQGRLLDNSNNKVFFNSYKSCFQALSNFCKKNSMTRLEACTKFILQNKKIIDHVVVGFSSHSELTEVTNLLKKKNRKKINFSNIDFSNIKKLIDPRKW